MIQGLQTLKGLNYYLFVKMTNELRKNINYENKMMVEKTANKLTLPSFRMRLLNVKKQKL